jgi:hypothetical protein
VLEAPDRHEFLARGLPVDSERRGARAHAFHLRDRDAAEILRLESGIGALGKDEDTRRLSHDLGARRGARHGDDRQDPRQELVRVEFEEEPPRRAPAVLDGVSGPAERFGPGADFRDFCRVERTVVAGSTVRTSNFERRTRRRRWRRWRPP